MSTGNKFEKVLYIPEGIVPENSVYSWACWYEGRDNLDRIKRAHCTIVPVGRHPDFYSDGSVKGAISRMGYFLVEKSKEAEEAYQNHLKEINISQCPDPKCNDGMTEKKLKNAKRLLKRRIKTGLYSWIQGDSDSEDGFFRLIKGEPHVNGI